jgi:sphingolipid delta-4 desaturase
MGPTPYTFPLVLLVLTTQLSLAIYMRSHHPFSLPFMLTAYVFGGTLNQNTFLAIHEITHNLAFKSLRENKVLAIVSNLAIGIPYAMAFKGYHREHHKYLGEEGIDTDLPSRFEALVLNNVAGKTFFACVPLYFVLQIMGADD